MTESVYPAGADRQAPAPLRIGEWQVQPSSAEISRNGEAVRLEARTLRLLLFLAEHAGEIVSIDTLLDQVWAGVNVSPDSVYQAVASLRRILGDDPKRPAYIANVPRLGYRMVAKVVPWRESPDRHDAAAETPTLPSSGPDPAHLAESPSNTLRRRGSAALWTTVAVLCLAIPAIYLLHNRVEKARSPASPIPAAGQNSVAVLPFLDLTEGMKNEEFADGITEELIDKLSKVPGLQVPSPTSSFYFKDKQVPVGEIAKALHVAYALDGSLRKSGTWIRVDVRLIRADSGFIVWSQTYDQPMSDILTIQDDIATKVTATLKASLGNTGAR